MKILNILDSLFLTKHKVNQNFSKVREIIPSVTTLSAATALAVGSQPFSIKVTADGANNGDWNYDGVPGTLTQPTGGATNLTPTAIKTSAYTAAANELVKTDTSSGVVPVTFPTGLPDKTRIAVKMITQGSTNATTIALSGSDVFNKAGGATSASILLLNQTITFQYELATGIWTAISSDTPISQLDIRYSGAVAIPQVYNIITDFGAVRYTTLAAAKAGTDATNAFKTAITTVAAAGGGRIIVPQGFYRISGALDTSKNGYAQIPLPLRSGTTDPYITIELYCPTPAGAAPWYSGSAGGVHGAILVSDLASSVYTTANGMPSVIGGPTLESQGYPWNSGSYFVPQFSSMHVSLRGIAVTQAGNPTRTAFDLGLISSVNVDDCRAQQDGAPTNVQPTNAHAWGLVMPRFNNHVYNDVRHFHVQGYFAGLSFDEHCTANSISIIDCEVGLVPTGQDRHPASFGLINLEQNHFDIAQIDPTSGVYDGVLNKQRAWFRVECMNIEDKPAFTVGDWRDKQTGANIYDPWNNLRAEVSHGRYVVSQGYDQGPMKITGGSGIVSREFTSGNQINPPSTVSFTTADSTTSVPARTQGLNEVGAAPIDNVRSKSPVQRAGTWGISSNKAYRVSYNTPIAGTHGASVVWDWFHSDGTLSCPITMSAGITYARIIMRAFDKDNYIGLQVYKNNAGNSNVTVFKVVNGVESTLGTGPSGELALSTTYVFSLTATGRDLVAKIDGVTKITTVITAFTRNQIVTPFHGIGSTGGAGNDDGGTRFGDITFTPKAG